MRPRTVLVHKSSKGSFWRRKRSANQLTFHEQTNPFLRTRFIRLAHKNFFHPTLQDWPHLKPSSWKAFNTHQTPKNWKAGIALAEELWLPIRRIKVENKFDQKIFDSKNQLKRLGAAWWITKFWKVLKHQQKCNLIRRIFMIEVQSREQIKHPIEIPILWVSKKTV